MKKIVSFILSKNFLIFCLLFMGTGLLIDFIWASSLGFDLFVIMIFLSTGLAFIFLIKAMVINYRRNKKDRAKYLDSNKLSRTK